MVNTSSLTRTKEPSVIYLPVMTYGIALQCILERDQIECKGSRPKDLTSDEETKKYWAAKIEKDAGRPVEWRLLSKYVTPFDPDELFELIAEAMKTDDEVKKSIDEFKPRRVERYDEDN